MAVFLVTVDTEADDAWGRPHEITLANIASIPRFQDLCEEYGVIPTYLVSYECASRDEAIAVLRPLKERGVCEIGHHLHVWTCPPFEQETAAGVDDRWLNAFQSELPDSLFEEKSECLKNAIFESYGDWPTSHRAGRWGIDERGVKWLAENGFRADSSVTPFISWEEMREGRIVGPSFYHAPLEPYLWNVAGSQSSAAKSILEIPLTVGMPSGLPAIFRAGLLRAGVPGNRLTSRALRWLGKPVMLRPTPKVDTSVLIAALRQAIGRQASVLNLMLHSSELLLGASPRSRTPESAGRVWSQLEAIFGFVRESEVGTATMSNAAAMIESKGLGRAAHERALHLHG